MTPAAGFVVGPGAPGTSERRWARSGVLDGLPSLALPAAGRAVVVAPHPDDEILAAGGLLQRLARRGTAIEVCAVTDGEAAFGPLGDRAAGLLAAEREAEAVAALNRLGLAGGGGRRVRLGLPDGGVAASELRLEQHLVDRLGPGMLCVAPWRRDGHPDHEAAGRAAAAAAAACGAELVEYPVWAWHWADPDELPASRLVRLDLSRSERARKRWAIRSFRSQTTRRAAGGPVLPPFVLRRFRRPFEVYLR